MKEYLGEETYVLMFPDGSYRAGFKTENEAWSYLCLQHGKPAQYLMSKGYAVGKCFVFIPENV